MGKKRKSVYNYKTMKRLISVLLFLFLLILIFDFRIRFIGSDISHTPFLLGFLLPVVSALLWGFVPSMIVLLSSTLLMGYLFLTPYNLYLLNTTDIKEMSLFVLEGIIILILILVLKRSREIEHNLSERFQVILSSVQDAVISTDSKQKIEYMNESAQKLFHKNHDFFDHPGIEQLLIFQKKEDKKLFRTTMQKAVAEKKLVKTERLVNLTNGNSNIDVHLSIAPLRDVNNNIYGTVYILRDISEQKELEEQREVLLGSISHELKNYISSIEGYAQVVTRRMLRAGNAEIDGFMMKLNHKIKTMRLMITSMLDLSKLKLGRLDMQQAEFPIEELIGTTIHDIQLTAKQKIVFTGKTSLKVFADKLRITQVLTNLIANALKYSPQAAPVQVMLQSKDGEAVVGVRDFGKGINAGQMKMIFKPFYRGGTDDEKMKVSGSGLGLYISRAIMRQNGGRIWVKSKQGRGATFYFSLPLMAKPKRLLVQPEKTMLDKFKKMIKFEKIPITKKSSKKTT